MWLENDVHIRAALHNTAAFIISDVVDDTLHLRSIESGVSTAWR